MIIDESAIKDMARVLVWGPTRRLMEQGPPGWETLAIRTMGRVGAQVMVRKRAQIRRNLGRAFPGHPQLDHWARQAFTAHFANQYAAFSFPKCNAHTQSHYLRFLGRDRLHGALKQGGVVLAQPHMGPGQWPLHLLGHLGYRVHQVAGGPVTAIPLSRMGRWAAQKRRDLEGQMPVTMHDARQGMRPVVRALEQGQIVITALDATGSGTEIGRRVEARVCGQPMGVPVGPMQLARLGGASLMTLRVFRSPGGGPPYTAEIEGPFPMQDQGDVVTQRQATATWVGNVLTRMLTESPGDWHFWDAFEPGKLLCPAS